MAKSTTPGAAGTAAMEQLMYIGPTLIDPVPLSHRSVYVGGIPKFAVELVNKDVDLKGCFVSLVEGGKALRELEGYPGTTPGEFTRRYKSVQKRYRKEA